MPPRLSTRATKLYDFRKDEDLEACYNFHRDEMDVSLSEYKKIIKEVLAYIPSTEKKLNEIKMIAKKALHEIEPQLKEYESSLLCDALNALRQIKEIS